MNEAVLQIRGICKSFGKRRVVDDVDLTVHAGEILGFLGPNGAGKTTTIKIATGFLGMDRGTVAICGYDLVKDYEKAMANVGGVVENPELYRDLTARSNLIMYARVQGHEARQRIDNVIELVGLKNRADEKIKRYSLGMKQRISLAQALLHKPKLLILDEPTNGLDPAGIRELRDILKTLAHEQGVGVLVSSHQLAEMQIMCDRVAIIAQGKHRGEFKMDALTNRLAARNTVQFRVAAGDVQKAEALLQAADTAFINSGDAFSLTLDPAESPALFKQLVLSDIRVVSMNTQQMSLEQAFLDITGGGSSID